MHPSPGTHPSCGQTIAAIHPRSPSVPVLELPDQSPQLLYHREGRALNSRQIPRLAVRVPRKRKRHPCSSASWALVSGSIFDTCGVGSEVCRFRSLNGPFLSREAATSGVAVPGRAGL